MDRVTVFPGQLPLETDVLNSGQYAMVGLGALAQAILGTSSAVDGLALTPLNPASMTVSVGPGSMYQLENVESTQWSSIAPDTRPLVKQGINLSSTPLTLVAPTSAGQSVVCLVQAAYGDLDTGQVVRPYDNPADPNTPFEGPGNDGAADNTVRKGVIVLEVKAGVTVTNGSPQAPTPDPGFVPLYLITLAAGQGAINTNNITAHPLAPFITPKIPQIPFIIQSNAYVYAVDKGGANHIVASVSPTPVQLQEGVGVRIKVAADCAGPTDCSLNGGPALPVVTNALAPLVVGQYKAGAVVNLILDGSGRWQISGVVTPAPVIPTYGSGEGVSIDGNNNANLAIQSLSENDSVSGSDSFVYYQTNAEGGQAGGHARKISFSALLSAIFASQNKPSPPNVIRMSTSGTYTSTPGAREIRVRGVGGGGAGGASGANNGPLIYTGYSVVLTAGLAGGGGAGGEFDMNIQLNGQITVAVTIGSGGIPPAVDSAQQGGNGGTTSFGVFASANGGEGGYPARNNGGDNSRGAGGRGGQAFIIQGTNGLATTGAVGRNAGDIDAGSGASSSFGRGGAGGDDVGYANSSGGNGGYGAGGGGTDHPANSGDVHGTPGAGGGGFVEITELF